MCEIPADEYNDPKIVQSMIAHWMTDVAGVTVETPSDFSGA
jgi:glutamate-1-semialdehyde aminotransferase